MDWGLFVAGGVTAVLLALRFAKLETDCLHHRANIDNLIGQRDDARTLYDTERKRNDAWDAWFEEAYPNTPWPDSVVKADEPL